MHAIRKPVAAIANPVQQLAGAMFKASLRDWRARYKAQRASQTVLTAKPQNQSPST